jgi:hypothetical protein
MTLDRFSLRSVVLQLHSDGAVTLHHRPTMGLTHVDGRTDTSSLHGVLHSRWGENSYKVER